jgi:hypothetical protein
MISIDENINNCQLNLQKLNDQRNDITSEMLRVEGSLRMLMDMKKMGVSIIETSEVLDISTPEPVQEKIDQVPTN